MAERELRSTIDRLQSEIHHLRVENIMMTLDNDDLRKALRIVRACSTLKSYEPFEYFFELPQSVMCKMFSEYLTLKEVVTLDTAVTETNSREIFLTALDNRECLFEDELTRNISLTPLKLQYIMKRNIKTTHFIFNGDVDNYNFPKLFIKDYPSLRRLTVKNSAISNDQLCFLLRKFTKLDMVSVINCTKVTEYLFPILQSTPCPTITKLNLELLKGCSNLVQKVGIDGLVVSMPNVTQVRINRPFLASTMQHPLNAPYASNSSSSLSSSFLRPTAVFTDFSQICQLDLRKVDIQFINDNFLLHLGEQCKNLEHLNLTNLAGRVTSIGLEAIGKNGKMRYLGIGTYKDPQETSANEGVDDEGLIAFSCFDNPLEELDLALSNTFTDRGIMALIKKYKKTLKKIRIHECALTDATFNCIAQNCFALQSLHFNVTNIFFQEQQGPLVSDSALRSLALNCPNLQSLTLKSCPAVSPSTLVNAVNSFRQLTHLKILVKGMEDEHINLICNFPPRVADPSYSSHVKHLEMCRSSRISENAVALLIKTFPNANSNILTSNRNIMGFDDDRPPYYDTMHFFENPPYQTMNMNMPPLEYPGDHYAPVLSQQNGNSDNNINNHNNNNNDINSIYNLYHHGDPSVHFRTRRHSLRMASFNHYTSNVGSAGITSSSNGGNSDSNSSNVENSTEYRVFM